ncbi:LacI family DNA-binding transcriptional regulator [Microbacterium sp.]|uniref:LacI family DNA-binding transcriptional regulator n=1 Tax=Microbacterium sp. TaxID=51671 RepID=UPI003F6FC50D
MTDGDDSENPGSRRPTLKDVAARAGVSETTASHVLTGRRYVAQTTQQRVRQVMQDLQYRPNQLARSLRVKTTQTVAFIVQDIGNVSATTSIRGASTYLRERGFTINMIDSPDEGFSSALLQKVLDQLPTGVIFFGQDPEPAAAHLLEQQGVPFVVGGLGAAHDADWDIVFTDQRKITRELTAIGLSRAPGRVCFFGGDWGDEGANTRLQGFLDAAESAHRTVTENDVHLVPYSIQGGRAAMEMELDDPPDLVVCGSDQIAIGAILRAREAGIALPDDMLICGFDNNDACEVVAPTLTSVEVHLAEQGMLCAEILLRRVDETPSERTKPVRHEVRPTIVARASLPI